MNQRILFFGYCLFAIVISYIPFIGLPFIYLATIFHEISHALVAVVTGAQVVEFALAVDGSGHVLSRGGSSFLIAISGYLGVSIWAALLFQAGTRNNLARFTIGSLIVLFSVTLILWVNNLMTALILGAVIGLLVLMLAKTSAVYITHLSRFVAIIVLFNAIKSPLYLIDGRAAGDGAILAKMTFVPEIVWVVLWCAAGLAVLYWLYQSLGKPQRH
ncbi:M50 family metallopeptidase [Psychrobium sp. MM17-31]|uniref:M50 family metallopeptidase n=1 Tax=Psychrobium sp. MM17-31 TaxID=2917758 RepID=UPI001EF69B1C|nr:M50 family metallopeptidase [Psychrobium sp. MM17-31]MCG7532174.1 M50 family metallopeptidase [Psychrobium sp. MM17-31]